jgi:hypothetical protein
MTTAVSTPATMMTSFFCRAIFVATGSGEVTRPR